MRREGRERTRAALLPATIVEATTCRRRRRLWEPGERHDREAASCCRRRRNQCHRTPAAPSPSNEVEREKVTSLPLLERSLTIVAARACCRKRGGDGGGSCCRYSASPSGAGKPLLQPLKDSSAPAKPYPTPVWVLTMLRLLLRIVDKAEVMAAAVAGRGKGFLTRFDFDEF
ncbi:uncharacterized protein DS421_18g614870 [Arachis hypogaea]|nr:uncharacterized protein DS421_18g614870 [Arachis hypogaea]